MEQVDRKKADVLAFLFLLPNTQYAILFKPDVETLRRKTPEQGLMVILSNNILPAAGYCKLREVRNSKAYFMGVRKVIYIEYLLYFFKITRNKNSF